MGDKPHPTDGILDNATYSNITEQSRMLVMHCLRHWMVRVEKAMMMSLLTDMGRKTHFIEHNAEALLRGDIKDRYEAYRIAREREQLKDDGIHITTSKTSMTYIIEWSDQLVEVVEKAKRLHCTNPNTVRFSRFLFCTRKGTAYTPDGFSSIWQRNMNKAMHEGVIQERFAEHDIRAKTASDSKSLEFASELSDHSDAKVTKRNYRRQIPYVKS